MGYKSPSVLAGLLVAGAVVSGCQTSRPIAHRPPADNAWNNPPAQQPSPAAVDGQAAGPMSTPPAPAGAALDTGTGLPPLTGKQSGLYPHGGNSSSNLNGASSGAPALDANPGGAASSLSANATLPALSPNPPTAPLASPGTGLQQPAAPANAAPGAGPGGDPRVPVDATLAPAMPTGGNDATRQTANLSPASALIQPYPAEPAGLSTAAPAASSFAATDDVPVLKPGQPSD